MRLNSARFVWIDPRMSRAAAVGICLCLIAALAPPVARGAWPRGTDSLVILHTNDIHAHLEPIEGSNGAIMGGAAARAALIGRERGGGAVLLLDAGDVFQGTPYYNFYRGVPDYRSMSLMRYDVGALGNHELDDGPAAWLRARREAAFPIATANVFVAAESSWASGLPPVSEPLRRDARWVGGARVPDRVSLRHLSEPYVMLRSGPLTVAVFALTTADIVRIVSRSKNGGVAVADPVAVAAKLVPDLRERADIVIALTHIGVEQDRALAARVPGIDLIVGGHGHTNLEKPILVSNSRNANGYRGTAIVQAGRWGERLGRVVLDIGPGGLRRVRGALLPVRPEDGEDATVREMLRPYRDSIATAVDEPVIRTDRAVTSEGLRDGETPLGDFVADVLRETAGADIAIINSGGIRAPLPAGTVTVGDLYSTLPFDNTVVAVTMEGWEVRRLLDFIARRIGKGGFGQVSGVQFVIRSDRATAIRVGGAPLDGGRKYRVATVDFLYEGGDGYTMFEKAGAAEKTGIFARDAAVAFLRRHPDYVFRKSDRIHWEGAYPMRDLLPAR